MRGWLKNNATEIFLLVILFFFVNIFSYVFIKGNFPSFFCWDDTIFFDTDDYMRLVRSFEWFSGGGFYEQSISRANSPFGGVMHWTRFYDLLWVAPVHFALLFTNSVRTAVTVVGFLISPVLTMFSLVLLLHISQFILNKKESFLVVALFLSHPFVISQTIFGRPDYHAFIVLMILFYMYFIIKLVFEDFKNDTMSICASVAAALCIWASPETLIPLLLSDFALFLVSIKNPNILPVLYFKSMITACALGILLSISGDNTDCYLLISLSLTLLPYTTYNMKYSKDIVMRNWHIVILVLWGLFIPSVGNAEYDKLSCVHVALYIYMALFFCINLFYSNNNSLCKLGYATFWGIIVCCAFLAIYPKFLFGMEANISEHVKQIWLNKVGEMRSPLSGCINYGFICFVITSVIALGYKLKNIISQKKISSKNITWWIFLLIGGCYTIFSCMAVRMIPYAVLFTCPVIVDFVTSASVFRKIGRKSREIVAVVLILLVPFIPKGGDTGDKNTSVWPHANTERTVYKFIDSLSDSPVVILASVNAGPELLWFTKHKIVASPYHRHTNGICAEYEILRNKFNPDVVRKYLKNTKTDYILIDKRRYFFGKRENYLNSFGYFVAKLSDETTSFKDFPPELLKWISIVPLQEKIDKFKKMHNISLKEEIAKSIMSNIVIAKVNKSALDE